MTKAYLNYPKPQITLHGVHTCAQIGKMAKPGQRSVQVTAASFAQVIHDLTTPAFRLGADASINDLWITVDFRDAEFEEAFIRYIHKLLVGRYSRLAQARVKRHC